MQDHCLGFKIDNIQRQTQWVPPWAKVCILRVRNKMFKDSFRENDDNDAKTFVFSFYSCPLFHISKNVLQMMHVITEKNCH